MLKKLRRFSVWLLLEALIFIAALTIIDVFDEELKTLIGAPKTTFVKWLVIGIAVLLYLIQQAKHRDRIPREEMVLKIIELHLTAIYGSENLTDFRAYVMILDAANRLKIKARYNMKREQPDYHLTLAIAAGTAGRAYNQRRTIAVDLNRVTLAGLHLSPEEATRIWQEVQSLLSIPMVNEDGKTVGVITFDSTLPMQETGFDYPAIQTYLETCAALLADWF